MTDDRYGQDVLAGFSRRPARVAPPRVEAAPGLVVEDPSSGFCGAVLRVDGTAVELEDRIGRVRVFPLGTTFLLEGQPAQLTLPARRAPVASRSASGSVAVAEVRARTARASRIFVEGRHDAELVEKVWGHDLRVEGVVVEYLEGIDDLESQLERFAPGADRRAGVLVDHLVPGSKESRIASAVERGLGPHVLVVGHPFVDIWQAVKPARLGLAVWPTVPRTVEWKYGICAALGWPHAEQEDVARAWQRILGRVSTYADLEPVLLGRVEQLIDFVTAVD